MILEHISRGLGPAGGLIYNPTRAGPPQPLGPGATHFPVSAATPLSLAADIHPSGYSIRVQLDNSRPNNTFRTSEVITGQLKIFAKPDVKRLVVPRLSLKVFFESRTLFAGVQPKQSGALGQKLQKMKSAAAQDYENVMMHESQLDTALEQGGNYSEVSLPFSFTIPRKMTVTEYNKYGGAPRKLCPVLRYPPPTLRDSSVGSVQWVVEAVIDLVPNAEGKKDEMMLLQPTDQQVLTRLVFPVMPSPEDVTPLRTEPFFGNDMERESFGSRRLKESEVDSKKKALVARGGKWEAYVKEIAVFEKYNVWSEVYVNDGAQISTNAPVFPLILFLKHTGVRASSLPSFLRSSKPKAIHLVRAKVTLRCTTSTRGGKEIAAHVRNVVIRTHELRFDSSSATPGVVIPSGDAPPLEVDLTFDVQSQEEMNLGLGKQFTTPARNLTPSFRTPNIEHEYHMIVSLLFKGDETERIATQFGVQVVPSDAESQLAPFQDALPEYAAN
ncbi:hypothetical protein RSOLAG22IIIB_03061 [Rhizoctonia solani]|uniref:Arrestin-like N-terminal domain-containing protein n=1 Tax=Rhizoctonia solani TaxID=456999 RepID=A0A0K6FMT8_9AGAM|nr:hypothetical protein RSOLAG22IIIB_03061 [Rhizoctonia solani]